MKRLFSAIGRYGCVIIFVLMIAMVWGFFLGAIFAASTGLSQLVGINKWIIFFSVLIILLACSKINTAINKSRRDSALNQIRKHGGVDLTAFDKIDDERVETAFLKLCQNNDYIVLLHVFEDQLNGLGITSYHKLTEETFLVQKTEVADSLPMILAGWSDLYIEIFAHPTHIEPDEVHKIWNAMNLITRRTGVHDSTVAYGLSLIEDSQVNFAILILSEFRLSFIRRKSDPIFNEFLEQLGPEAVQVI